MFKWIKKLFRKEQPSCEYAHIVCVLQEIQKSNKKTKKKVKQNVKNKTKKSK